MPISLPAGGSAQPTTPLLLTGRQAAQLVSLCEKSLYLAARRGELRVVRIGRAVRYRLEDIQAWVNAKVVQETARG